MKEERGLKFDIQVDGSCNNKTFKQLYDAGTEIFILGSSGLFNRDKDIHKAFSLMREDFSKCTGVSF